MSPRRRPPTARTLLVGLTTAAVSVALLGSSPLAASASDSGTPSSGRAGSDRVERERAQEVLGEAQSLFDGRPTRVAPGRDATMVLRDLSLARDSLTGADRLQADRLLARPAATRSACTTTACFHWSETGPDAVDATDGDANGYPDYIDEVASVVGDVQATYVGAGYREVKSDGTKGGNSLPDIYLADVGADSLYGYCNSDQPIPAQGPFDAYAFCALDNDYAVGQFGTLNTPLENIEVTAAHEYFHAVQFAYDYLEDSWLMEATATWAEDELYTDVNDNLQYLTSGPLSRPATSLDTFGGSYQYGTWLFFRYLTERLTAEEGGLPTLVRDIWRKADGSAAGPDEYSMQAVASVLKARGTSLPNAFAAFAVANRRPAVTYSEGAVNAYPTAPLGKFTKKSGWYVTSIDHLSSSTARLTPTPGYSKLRVDLDMVPKAAGSAAVTSVHLTDGSVQTASFALNKKGNGSHTYPFDPATVTAVEVTLVNTSAKYACWRNGAYSCQGKPKFDDQPGRIRGLLVK